MNSSTVCCLLEYICNQADLSCSAGTFNVNFIWARCLSCPTVAWSRDTFHDLLSIWAWDLQLLSWCQPDHCTYQGWNCKREMIFNKDMFDPNKPIFSLHVADEQSPTVISQTMLIYSKTTNKHRKFNCMVPLFLWWYMLLTHLPMLSCNK